MLGGGWAIRAAGARWSVSRSASTSWVASPRPPSGRTRRTRRGRARQPAHLVEPAQVVRGEAGADDHRPRVAQGASARPTSNNARGSSVGIELQHRDVGVGVHLHERHISTVIKTAGLIALDHPAQQPVDIGCEVGRGGGVVGHLVVFLWEPPEVIQRRTFRAETLTAMGAASQWAETIKICFGRANCVDHEASSAFQVASSASGRAVAEVEDGGTRSVRTA